jgi:di/tricarboxylate transporter
MAWDAWTTVGVVLLVIGLLVFTHVATDLVMVGALTLLLTFGVLQPADALAGFANEGVIAIGALFVVAAGIRETGAMQILAPRLLGRPRSVAEAQARLIFPAAGLSAFIYNDALVSMMLPVVDDWGKKHRVPASKLMMLLNYAVILGGICTLLGTSTNLVVNGLVISQARLPALGLFDITWVGLPCALVGLAYLLVAGRWLLPVRQPAFTAQDDARLYTVEMIVEPSSAVAGRTIEEAGLRQLPGLFLVEIDRDQEILPAVSPHERLRANDRLVFAGVVESVVDLQKMRGLKPATDQVFKLDSPRSHRCLIEAVVSNTCPLAGKTVREGRFRTVYNAAIIAVARNGERLRGKIGGIVLQAGDTLLLEAHPWFVQEQRNSRDFYLISRVDNSTPARHERAWVALAILLGLIVTAALGWLSMLNAALLAAGLMVLTQCCSGTEARASIDWRVLTVIGAALGLGRAMEVSGAARAMVETVLSRAGGPWVALAAVYLVTMLFSEIMSHTTAVVLVFPVALATAHGLRVDAMPFIMVMMIAASCAFATPICYPTHLMVYGPGNYRFGDYFRIGAPLNLLVGTVAVALTPLVWPF